VFACWQRSRAKVHVLDVGIDSDPIPGVINMKVARGSNNIARGRQ
jgi:nicotinate-nucleotide--dimethylbenzimidazole phosphoribosyltransferase